MKKPTYIRCPRCELNYILKKDKICSVCQAELDNKGEDYIDELDLELCPVCKTNYIQPDEIMCAGCLKERAAEGKHDSDEWEDYVNRDQEEVVDEDEETGDMASVTDIDDDILGVEEPLAFDDDEEEIQDEALDEEFDDDDDDDLLLGEEEEEEEEEE